jgi:hypothetical protein
LADGCGCAGVRSVGEGGVVGEGPARVSEAAFVLEVVASVVAGGDTVITALQGGGNAEDMGVVIEGVEAYPTAPICCSPLRGMIGIPGICCCERKAEEKP